MLQNAGETGPETGRQTQAAGGGGTQEGTALGLGHSCLAEVHQQSQEIRARLGLPAVQEPWIQVQKFLWNVTCWEVWSQECCHAGGECADHRMRASRVQSLSPGQAGLGH